MKLSKNYQGAVICQRRDRNMHAYAHVHTCVRTYIHVHMRVYDSFQSLNRLLPTQPPDSGISRTQAISALQRMSMLYIPQVTPPSGEMIDNNPEEC